MFNYKKYKNNKKQILIFLHIPKAAGTTLHHIIEKQYDKNELYTIDGKNIDKSIKHFKNLSANDIKKIKCIKGHMFFGIHNFLSNNNYSYITFLRDPVERIISEYYYLLNISKSKLHKKIISKKLNLSDYINSDITINADNIQTRLIGGHEENLLTDTPKQVTYENLQIAKKYLKNNFKFVGLVEQFDESLIILKKMFNWKNIYYAKKNTNKKRPDIKNIPNNIIEEIKKRNCYDIELYKFTKELLSKNIENYGPYFDKNLKNFRELNKFYSFFSNLQMKKPARLIKRKISIIIKKIPN